MTTSNFFSNITPEFLQMHPDFIQFSTCGGEYPHINSLLSESSVNLYISIILRV